MTRYTQVHCLLLLLAIIGFAVGCCRAANAQDLEPQPELQVDCPQYSNVVLWIQCGTSGDKANLGASPTLIRGGWEEVDRVQIRPYVDWFESKFNAKLRILLHLPFGWKQTDAQTKMPMSGYIDAVRDKKRFFTDGFIKTIKGYTDAGHEVIVYIGRPSYTVALKQIADIRSKKDNVMQLEFQYLKLPLHCDCSIAFDSMSSLGRTQHDEALFDYVTSLTKTYTEATLRRGQANEKYWDANQIVAWETFNRRHTPWQREDISQHFPNWEWDGEKGVYFCDDWYKGEVLVLLDGRSAPDIETIERRVRQLRDFGGQTPVLNAGNFAKVVRQWPVVEESDR